MTFNLILEKQPKRTLSFIHLLHVPKTVHQTTMLNLEITGGNTSEIRADGLTDTKVHMQYPLKLYAC